MTHLSLYLLGAFQAVLDDRPVTDFATDKARALLAYLAVEADRAHRRDAIAGLLWPDQPQRKARQNLRQALSHLRQAIDDLDDEMPFLLVSRETIQFNPAGDYQSDVAVFTDLIADCRSHRHRRLETCHSCTLRLKNAAELYRGSFLEQFSVGDSVLFEDWMALKREWLHLQAIEALSHLADYHERRGEHGLARQYAWRHVELEPWREEAHRQLMRLLALEGQRSAALAQYEACRRVLAEELGVAPTDETVVLYERIQSGELHEAPTPSYNLPPSPTPFVGREAELAELADLLADPDCRLLTLLGPGGIGKTRLALQAAGEQMGAFAHGIFYVPLTSLSSPAHLLPALADTLGFSFQGRQAPLAQLLSYLREKEMLLVLDSLEHLLQGGELLAAILRRAPGVVLLVTSRERLNLPGETVYEIGGLEFPAHGAANELRGRSAIELFLERARRAYRGFALSEEGAPHVVRVCQLVEGMPLAIELAAAWVAVRSCEEIAREIEGNLDVLSSFMRNVPERHQSVRATFEYSWDLLSEQERRVFAGLSVFRGGFQADAAGQIADASPPTLSALLDKSLLREDASGRYDMHGLLRQFSAEKLMQVYQGDKEARDRHVAYYTVFLQQRERALQGAEQKQALETISAEVENVRAAWTWAVSARMGEAIARSLGSLRLFYDMRSWFQEAEEAFGRAARALEEAGGLDGEGQRLVGRVLACQGGGCFRLGLYEEARELLQRSVAIFQSLDERSELASALISLGHVALYQQGHDEAKRCYDKSLALNRENGNLMGISEALNSLGVVLRVGGSYAGAKQAFEEALAIGRRLENRWRISFYLNNLGIVSRMMGEYQAAKAHYQESLAIKKEFSDLRGAAISLNNLGNISYALQEFDEAQRLHRSSMAICQEIGDQQGVARSLNNLGMAAHAQGRYTAAHRLHAESLAIKQEIGDQRGMIHSFSHLGKAAVELGAHQQAREDFCQALKMALEMKAFPLALFALEGMAELLAKENEPEQAIELLALVCHHSASEQWTRDQAMRLLAELASELSPQARAAAEERGKTRQLEVVVTEVLCGGVAE